MEYDTCQQWLINQNNINVKINKPKKKLYKLSLTEYVYVKCTFYTISIQM